MRKGRGELVLLALLAASCEGPSHSPTGPMPVPTPAPGEPALACGVERWPVKTLSDPDAGRVNFTPISSTISLLNAVNAHCGGGPNAQRAFAEELQVYEVVGRITLVRGEDDGDFHIALADPANPADTMVVEVADPGCVSVAGASYLGSMAAARSSLGLLRAGRPLSALRGEMVRVRGVGFFDFNHGQTGRSRSCIELHPVLAIDAGG